MILFDTTVNVGQINGFVTYLLIYLFTYLPHRPDVTATSVCYSQHVVINMCRNSSFYTYICDFYYITVVEVDTVDQFKSRVDKFWMYQNIKYDFTGELTGTEDRSEYDLGGY